MKELEAERKRLAVGQEQLRNFIREVRAVCNEELAALDLLPELPAAEEPAPAVVLPQREKAVQAEPEEAEEAVPAFSAAPPEEEPEEPVQIDEDGTYNSVEDVSLYLYTYDHLPDNYITKNEARELGWTGGSVEQVAPGCAIGGDRFGNREVFIAEVRFELSGHLLCTPRTSKVQRFGDDRSIYLFRLG